jgi:signal recognition particle GTPase
LRFIQEVAYIVFESLSDKLSQTFNKLKGRGTLNEKNIEDALKEVRLALLEADVNYKVVKKFIQDEIHPGCPRARSGGGGPQEFNTGTAGHQDRQ